VNSFLGLVHIAHRKGDFNYFLLEAIFTAYFCTIGTSVIFSLEASWTLMILKRQKIENIKMFSKLLPNKAVTFFSSSC
jgi:hypothetical protein